MGERSLLVRSRPWPFLAVLAAGLGLRLALALVIFPAQARP